MAWLFVGDWPPSSPGEKNDATGRFPSCPSHRGDPAESSRKLAFITLPSSKRARLGRTGRIGAGLAAYRLPQSGIQCPGSCAVVG